MIDKESPRKMAAVLSNVFSLANDDATAWNPDELGEIFAHQLSASLALEISRLNLTADERQSLQQMRLKPDQSIRDLFTEPSPQLKLLNWVKEYAKAAGGDPHQPIPKPICLVLYYTCIAKARRCYNHRITTIDDEAIRRGLLWAREQPWIDPVLLPVFRGAIEAFHSD